MLMHLIMSIKSSSEMLKIGLSSSRRRSRGGSAASRPVLKSIILLLFFFILLHWGSSVRPHHLQICDQRTLALDRVAILQRIFFSTWSCQLNFTSRAWHCTWPSALPWWSNRKTIFRKKLWGKIAFFKRWNRFLCPRAKLRFYTSGWTYPHHLSFFLKKGSVVRYWRPPLWIN